MSRTPEKPVRILTDEKDRKRSAAPRWKEERHPFLSFLGITIRYYDEEEDALAAPPQGKRSKAGEDYPRAERVTADKPRTERVTADKPRAERVTADKPRAERTTEDKPRTERAAVDYSRAERTTEDKPRTERAAVDYSRAEHVTADKPHTESKDKEQTQAPRRRTAEQAASAYRHTPPTRAAHLPTREHIITPESLRTNAADRFQPPADETTDRRGGYHPPADAVSDRKGVSNSSADGSIDRRGVSHSPAETASVRRGGYHPPAEDTTTDKPRTERVTPDRTTEDKPCTERVTPDRDPQAKPVQGGAAKRQNTALPVEKIVLPRANDPMDEARESLETGKPKHKQVHTDEAEAKPSQANSHAAAVAAAEAAAREADAAVPAKPLVHAVKPIDLFAEDEPESDELAENVKAAPDDADAVAAMADAFRFDRYGRRIRDPKDRRRNAAYGRRKHAKKASTILVQQDTTAQRELTEAQKRAAERDTQRRKQLRIEEARRREERRAKNRRLLSVLSVLAGLLIVLALLLYFSLRITDVNVTGDLTRYTAAELIDKSGVVLGKHILAQDLSAAESRLNDDAYLQATVQYVFPNQVQITVTERKEAAAVLWGPSDEYIAVIDGTGMVLKSRAEDAGTLLRVLNLEVTSVTERQRLGDSANEQLASLLDVLDKLSEYGLDDRGSSDRLASLDMGEPMSMSLYTASGYRIELGDSNDLDIKCRRLSTYWDRIMSTAASYSSSSVTIYLYGKSGVIVSPHEPGYVDSGDNTLLPGSTDQPSSTDNVLDPSQTQAPQPSDAYGTPLPTDTPAPSNVPYASDPFTG